jgi:drug/metabolite transporter (DMT)-like permease
MNPTRRAVVALAATTLVWGSTFVVVGELVSSSGARAGFPPLLLLALRFALAAALMLAVLVARGHRIHASAWKRGAFLGLLTCGGFAFQTFGLQHTTSARSAFITNVSLVLVPLFGALLGRGRPPASIVFGLAVALAGLWALEFPWDLASSSSDRVHLGDLLTLGCAIFFAFQILATESYAPTTPLVPLVFTQFLTCAAAGAVLSLLSGELGPPISLPGGASTVGVALLYLGVIATGLCLLVQAWAQRYASATRAAIIFTLEPVFATVLAYVVRNERLTAVQWLGAALVLGGILATELLSARAWRQEDAVRPLAPPGQDWA